jgi:MFS family permease
MMETPAPSARLAPAPALDPRRWQALALLCGAFFMLLLDGTITIVALPSIGADLGFSKQGLPWVLSAYALTFGGLLLLGGHAADLLGRRRVFMAGVMVFTAASLLCGLAWSPAALIAARMVQGAGAANPLVVLTAGYRSAFAAGVVLAGIGLVLALLLPGRPRKAAHELPESAVAASARD